MAYYPRQYRDSHTHLTPQTTDNSEEEMKKQLAKQDIKIDIESVYTRLVMFVFPSTAGVASIA